MRAALAVAVLLCAALPGLAGPAPGILHRSAAGGYRVWLPAAPRELETDLGEGVLLRLEWASDAPRSLVYSAGWVDHFPEVRGASRRALEAILRRALGREGLMLKTTAARLGGREGLGFRAGSGLDVVLGRLALRDARLYVLMVSGPKEAAGLASGPFFESFALDGPGISRPPAAPAARRVPFGEAGVSLVMHGEPIAEKVERPEGVGLHLVARSRQGLRAEMATFFPGSAIGSRRAALVDGVVEGLRRERPVNDLRSFEVGGAPVRDLRTRVGDDEAVVRVQLVERGTLVLQLVAPPGGLDPAEVAAFFDSVRPDVPADQ